MSYGVHDPRLSFAPLEATVATFVRPRAEGDQMVTGDRMVAEACGVARRTVLRWRRHGLTWDTADKAACALGLHPSAVWRGEWWAAVPAEGVA